MPVDPGAIVGTGIGITNSLVNAIKGIKQVKDGKEIQEKLDAQGRPILDTPEAFNEIEGLVRSNYLDPRLTGETRIKDSIKAREANQIQNIQDTATSGADALFAYGLANANTDNSLFNVDMKAYEQQQNDYNKLLGTLGQKANYEEKQFDFNVVQPFMESAEQAKALIAAGEQNRNAAFSDVAGYATSGFSSLNGILGNKGDDEKKPSGSELSSNRAAPSTIKTSSAFINPVIGNKKGTAAGFNSNQAGDVGGIDIGQLQQLLQLLNANNNTVG
jgi:hypothetical protein